METDGITTAPETSSGDLTAIDNTNPTRFPACNRFSSASLSSIRTVLPQYSVVDPLQGPLSPTQVAIPSPGAPPSWNSTTLDSGSTLLLNMTEPPRYSLINPPGELVLTWTASTATLPEVVANTHEFQYSYPVRPKKPWATLHLHTRDAAPGNPKALQSQPRVPRFWGCDPITGILELDLDSPQKIQQIIVSLNGSIVMSPLSAGTFQFLGHELTLWDKSMGDPLQSDLADGHNTQKKKIDGQFAPGQYSFLFSFPFATHANLITKSAVAISPFPPLVRSTQGIPYCPLSVHEQTAKYSVAKKKTNFASSSVLPSNVDEALSSSQKQTSSRSPASVMVSQARRSNASPLPQSFMEKGINYGVAYEISVRIVHGRFKTSSRIKTNIAYFPASQPFPASQKRREAYEAGAFLPCPMNDPEGWLASPTLTIYGVVNSDALRPRHSKAQCTLYLAQPLSYTRGSVIPCFITISSDDDEAVRLLANPKTPIVRLLRRIRHPMAMGEETQADSPGVLSGYAGLDGLATHAKMVLAACGEMTLVSHEVGRAHWWLPSKDVGHSLNLKHLEGEIHLSSFLYPSCEFQFLQVEYAAELLSFQTDNFVPEVHPPSLENLRKPDNVLASIPVEITTLYRQDEPIPLSYSKPPKVNPMRRVNSDHKDE